MITGILLSALMAFLSPAIGEEVATPGQNGDAVKGSGNVVMETRNLETFDAIELRIPADMRVTVGKPTPLTIKTDDNVMSLIRVEVCNGKLVISSDREFNAKNVPDITVTVAKLRAVEVVGAGDMWISKIDNAELSVAVTGAGDVHLSGKTTNLAVAATGAADINAYELDAKTVSATLTGAADARLSVSESLNVTITGAGDVHYKGNPKVTKTIIGFGDVKKTG